VEGHVVARFIALLAGAAVALALAPGPADADDALSVIAGANQTAFFEVLNNVAQLAGFYKEQHLNVTTQYAGSPNIAAQLLSSGKGDIGGMSIEPIILGYEKGIRLTAFFTRDPSYDYVLGVLADGPVKSLSDLKGATLGEFSVGSPAEISTNAMLEGAGLKKSDVTYIPIGSGAQAISALTTGKVAGAAFPFPELASYEVIAGLKFRYFFNPLLRDVGNTAYVATPATIQNKGDLLQRFARANAMAAVLVRENPRLAARYFLQGAGVKITDKSLDDETRLLELDRDQLPGTDPESKRIGLLPTLGIQLYIRFLAGAGLIAQIPPTSAIATDQFIAYANDFDHNALIARVKQMR
jgi:NitT/TauT family transport system substrate-binding protein